jgi:hypothetical protein
MRNIIRGLIAGALIVAAMSIGGYTAFAQTPAPNMSFFDKVKGHRSVPRSHPLLESIPSLKTPSENADLSKAIKK